MTLNMGLVHAIGYFLHGPTIKKDCKRSRNSWNRHHSWPTKCKKFNIWTFTAQVADPGSQIQSRLQRLSFQLPTLSSTCVSFLGDGFEMMTVCPSWKVNRMLLFFPSFFDQDNLSQRAPAHTPLLPSGWTTVLLLSFLELHWVLAPHLLASASLRQSCLFQHQPSEV